jgi:pyridoxine 5-phosphate synthase
MIALETPLRLGVNIDHVATLRQARYARMPGAHHEEPSVIEAARQALAAGAHSITAHLRDDRRHVQDRDIAVLRAEPGLLLNFEMGNTPGIVAIAVATRADFACLVPEHRQEVTTEGGLAVADHRKALAETVRRLQGVGTKVSMFVDPESAHLEASAEIGAEMVELHTGTYANAAPGPEREAEARRLAEAAVLARGLGLQVNAGHGITMGNLPGLFGVPHLVELNIGHHLVSRAVTVGLGVAVQEMLAVMAEYRG